MKTLFGFAQNIDFEKMRIYLEWIGCSGAADWNRSSLSNKA
jgi:hypothetical protein